MPSLGENYLPRIAGIPKHVSFVLMEGALLISLGVSGGQQQPECRRSHVWSVPGTSKDRDSRVCPGGGLRSGELCEVWEDPGWDSGLPRFQAQTSVCWSLAGHIPEATPPRPLRDWFSESHFWNMIQLCHLKKQRSRVVKEHSFLIF